MGRGRSQKSIDLVATAAEILEEIQPASVRAVCYQLFIRGVITGMDKATTNRVGSLLTRAREEGEIAWEWIVQEARAIEGRSTWKDPAAYARAVRGYRRDKWAGQPKHVIVVSEKGTVRGTLAPVLDELEVEFLAIGGYSSATRIHELAEMRSTEQPVLLLYLGDYDPSGRHMSDADLPHRLYRYASADPSDKGLQRALRGLDAEKERKFMLRRLAAVGLEVRRIALTIEDTEALGRGALSFPAADKEADPRYPWFVAHYGDTCWELDAMNPNVLRERVRGAVMAELDLVEWDRYVAAEALERESIEVYADAIAAISGLARK